MNAGFTLPAAPDATPVSDWDRAVFERYWDYDFEQAGFAWPSQDLVARDLGRSRYSVHRSVKRLVAAGWMRLHEKRWGKYRNGRRWLHNVYELLEPGRPRFKAAADRIVARAVARRFRTSVNRLLRPVHTNHVVVVSKVEFAGLQRRRMSAVMVR